MINLKIDNIEYAFEEKHLTYQNSKIIDKKAAKDILLILKRVLETKHLNFYLMYGTLLGAIRDKDFIEFDIDIDVIVFDEEKLIKCIPKLLKEGLVLVRLEKETKTYSFMRNDCYIDVYVVNNIKGLIGRFYYRLIGKLFPKKYFKNFTELNFLGVDFKIPNNPQNLLQYLYGNNWNIPIKNKPSIDEPKYIFIIKNVLKTILPKKIVLKIIKFKHIKQ